MLAVLCLALPGDERRKALGQQGERPPDPLVVRDRHRSSLLRLRCWLVGFGADELGGRLGGTLEDSASNRQAERRVPGGPLIDVSRVASSDRPSTQILECRLVKRRHYGRSAAFEQPSQIMKLWWIHILRYENSLDRFLCGLLR
jgi:hypothetical protein